jgi:hypothetical protein
MKSFFLAILLLGISYVVSKANADIGLSAGLGVPYVSQFDVNATLGQNFSINLGHNALALSSGLAKLTLTMPELMFNWHPFAGSFFIGLGAGYQSLKASATDSSTNLTASAEVNSMTTIAQLGWMWGKADGGFWMGMDLAFISPASSEVKIVAPGLTANDKEYKDVEKAAKDFGELSYINFTFLRLGYLF